jgi:hypothetical protein
MHLGDVAFDIQSQILQLCSPKDLANLSAVHTSLRDAAEYVLYSHIYVSLWVPSLIVGKGTRKSPWAWVEKRSLLHTLASNSRKAEMVKALDIDLAATGHHNPDRVLPLMASKLAEVLETMPNLVDLRIKYGLTSNSSVERTISQVVRFVFFQYTARDHWLTHSNLACAGAVTFNSIPCTWRIFMISKESLLTKLTSDSLESMKLLILNHPGR